MKARGTAESPGTDDGVAALRLPDWIADEPPGIQAAVAVICEHGFYDEKSRAEIMHRVGDAEGLKALGFKVKARALYPGWVADHFGRARSLGCIPSLKALQLRSELAERDRAACRVVIVIEPPLDGADEIRSSEDPFVPSEALKIRLDERALYRFVED